MAVQLSRPAAGQQEKQGRRWNVLFRQLHALVAVNHGVTDEFDAQLRDTGGVPILLEREDAQQQINVAGDLIGATGAGGPDLRRDVLDYFRVPVVERSLTGADVILYRGGKAAVEPGKIDTNDGVRLATDG